MEADPEGISMMSRWGLTPTTTETGGERIDEHNGERIDEHMSRWGLTTTTAETGGNVLTSTMFLPRANIRSTTTAMETGGERIDEHMSQWGSKTTTTKTVAERIKNHNKREGTYQ